MGFWRPARLSRLSSGPGFRSVMGEKNYVFVTLDLEFRSIPFEPSGMLPKLWGINDLPSVPSCVYRVYVVPRGDLLLLIQALNVASNYYWESCFSSEQEFKKEP
jgi:hypothetical protein